MTVKIIGKKPVKARQTTCPKCRFRLEYTGVDVASSWHTDYSGESEECHYIVCPKCNERVVVRRWD